MKADINCLVKSIDPDLKKPADQDPHFFQCNIINQSMKHRIILTLAINLIHLYVSKDQ